MKVVFEGFRRH